jgi:hypothetical protein
VGKGDHIRDQGPPVVVQVAKAHDKLREGDATGCFEPLFALSFLFERWQVRPHIGDSTKQPGVWEYTTRSSVRTILEGIGYTRTRIRPSYQPKTTEFVVLMIYRLKVSQRQLHFTVLWTWNSGLRKHDMISLWQSWISNTCSRVDCSAAILSTGTDVMKKPEYEQMTTFA